MGVLRMVNVVDMIAAVGALVEGTVVLDHLLVRKFVGNVLEFK
jgi:hypothetical protein